jgi:hypothetical protein
VAAAWVDRVVAEPEHWIQWVEVELIGLVVVRHGPRHWERCAAVGREDLAVPRAVALAQVVHYREEEAHYCSWLVVEVAPFRQVSVLPRAAAYLPAGLEASVDPFHDHQEVAAFDYSELMGQLEAWDVLVAAFRSGVAASLYLVAADPICPFAEAFRSGPEVALAFRRMVCLACQLPVASWNLGDRLVLLAAHLQSVLRMTLEDYSQIG